MSKLNTDWAELLDPAREEDRELLSYDDIEAESRAFVAAVQRLLDHELKVLCVDARKASDAFWAANRDMREEGGPGEQGYFGTRVRIVGNSLVAEWYRNRFAGDGTANGKKRVFSTYIEKGKGFRYPQHRFAKARDWEKQVIEIVESRYEMHRKRAHALSKLRRALRDYERLLDASYHPATNEGEEDGVGSRNGTS